MITLIAAIDNNRLIGRDSTLPWHIPADFKHFKETTLGYPIIMGRKTYDSLPKRPLPGRVNLVVSRAAIEGVKCFTSIPAALEEGLRLSEEVFVIGGQSIYEQTINQADRLLITHVDGVFEGNYWFPEITPSQWQDTRILQEGGNFRIMEYLACR